MHTKPSATDRTYRHAKDAILSRRYAGGDLISEGDLAAAVGVSRTPVREALLRLEAEGLVRLYPKRGALVVPVSQQEVDDVIGTRRLVEGHTAELAAGTTASAHQELTQRLAAHLADMRAHAAAGQRRGFVLADREFHRAIVTAGGNQILNKLYESLRDRQLRMMEEGLRSAAHMATSISDHAAILSAVRHSDATAARAAVQAHMDTAAKMLGARR